MKMGRGGGIWKVNIWIDFSTKLNVCVNYLSVSIGLTVYNLHVCVRAFLSFMSFVPYFTFFVGFFDMEYLITSLCQIYKCWELDTLGL